MTGLDGDALARDVASVVQVPSVTGDERAVLERVGEIAGRLGLEAQLIRHDLGVLRAHPGHPGEEAPRHELWGLEIVSGAAGPAGRLCLNGHVDVVGPGEQAWERDPFSGAVAGGFVHGRGSADMKAGVVAAVHALAAVGAAAPAQVVLQVVASEEDGGLGTFAALERDAAFDAALIPEPTAFAVACAQAGALTFGGVVPGVSAHAAVRLEGISAIDRYVEIHRALAEHERRLNEDVGDPLMRELELPYPLLVGRVAAGRWSSQVPDLLRFEGRLGVRVGESVEDARAAFEAVVGDACPEAEVSWTGGQFVPGATPAGHPFVALVRDAAAQVLGATPPVVGVPYGSDMGQFAARGIPAVLFGTPGLERAHAADERVRVDDVLGLARTLAHVLRRFRSD